MIGGTRRGRVNRFDAQVGLGEITTDDDEFAGDTQRWEPPQGMAGISVQTLPTQEDRAVRSSEETEKAPHAQGATGPRTKRLRRRGVRARGTRRWSRA